MSKTGGAVVPVQRIFDMSIGNSGQPDVCLFTDGAFMAL